MHGRSHWSLRLANAWNKVTDARRRFATDGKRRVSVAASALIESPLCSCAYTEIAKFHPAGSPERETALLGAIAAGNSAMVRFVEEPDSPRSSNQVMLLEGEMETCRVRLAAEYEMTGRHDDAADILEAAIESSSHAAGYITRLYALALLSNNDYLNYANAVERFELTGSEWPFLLALVASGTATEERISKAMDQAIAADWRVAEMLVALNDGTTTLAGLRGLLREKSQDADFLESAGQVCKMAALIDPARPTLSRFCDLYETRSPELPAFSA